MRVLICLLFVTVLSAPATASAVDYPPPREGDYTLENFVFADGETMAALNIHYTVIGAPRRDADGQVVNAVLILHGTTGSGHQFLRPQFADELYGPGQLLDARKYFIILPDGIGHGNSSKPSDGLRMAFPKYNYDDMVKAQYRLLTEHLKVDRLRLVMGTSMGGMHTWVWAYAYPDFIDAAMPLASLPIEIAGRNRMMRKMIIDTIEDSPDWNGGNYEKQPLGLKAAMYPLLFMVSSPLEWQKQAPTREAAEAFMDAAVARYAAAMDANDLIYQFDASRDYNPAPHLSAITAPLLAINSADDQVNPPELDVLEAEIKKVPRGRAIVLPITDETRGHGTHSLPKIWGGYLAELLAETERH